MNRNDSWRRTGEIEIDLADLLRRLCRQWKQIAVCALCMAVLLGVYGFFAGGETMEADDSAAEVESVQEPVSMTKEEREQGVADAMQLAEETRRLEEYLDHSVLMQVDPYHKNSVILLFGIEEASNQTVQAIVDGYLNFLTGEQAFEALRKTDQELDGIDSMYLAEIISAWQKANGTYRVVMDDKADDIPTSTLLYIETIGKDDAMAQRLAKSVRTVVEAYSRSIQKSCGAHVLNFLRSEARTRFDSSLESQQRDKRALLTANRTSLKALVDAFDEEQKILYDSLMEENENQAGSDGNESQAMSKDGENETGILNQAETGSGESSHRIRIIYILFGFAGGIFVYAAVYACWYMLQDTVKTVREFQSYYTLPFYGHILFQKNRRRKPADGNGRFEKEKAQLLNRLRLSCKKQGVQRLCLAADFMADTAEKECMESIRLQLQEWGIDAVTADHFKENISMWDMAAETGTVLLLCRIGTSTHQMIDDEMGFYTQNDIAVLGVAAFERR